MRHHRPDFRGAVTPPPGVSESAARRPFSAITRFSVCLKVGAAPRPKRARGRYARRINDFCALGVVQSRLNRRFRWHIVRTASPGLVRNRQTLSAHSAGSFRSSGLRAATSLLRMATAFLAVDFHHDAAIGFPVFRDGLAGLFVVKRCGAWRHRVGKADRLSAGRP